MSRQPMYISPKDKHRNDQRVVDDKKTATSIPRLIPDTYGKVVGKKPFVIRKPKLPSEDTRVGAS